MLRGPDNPGVSPASSADVMKPSALRMNAPWLTLLAVGAAMLSAAGGRHLIKKIAIPGDYGWDYLTADSEGRRLYVSHDQEVVALDLDSGVIVGKVPGSDVHGIAVVRELGRDFISATDQVR